MVASQLAGLVAIGCCTGGVYLRAGIGSEGFASDDGKMNGKVGSKSKTPHAKTACGAPEIQDEMRPSAWARLLAAGRLKRRAYRSGDDKSSRLSERCMVSTCFVRHQSRFKAIAHKEDRL